MVTVYRILIGVQLFCYWLFLAKGFVGIGKLAHVLGTVACVWSIYSGIIRHYKLKDGEGLAWAIIGALVFVGFSARWLVSVP